MRVAKFGYDAKKLDDEAMKIIEECIAERLEFKQIVRRLQKRFPGRFFLPQIISNAIQKAKKGNNMHVPETMRLVALLQDRKSEDDRWFFELDFDPKTMEFRRLFWMSPTQVEQYQRYCDIVVQDNTAQTNRFDMPLSVFVVVDANGRSIVVACALVCGETTRDYEWILEQLLTAGKQPPMTLLVDEDPAMEAACSTTIPGTKVINCIWHIGCQNIPKNLKGALGGRWQAFISQFWRVRNSLTEAEFTAGWEALVQEFGDDNNKVQTYLARLEERRDRWAWPWVSSRFTAGMQSTQRVEKAHHYLKSLISRSDPLEDLFNTIQEKVLLDQMNKDYSRYTKATRSSRQQNNTTRSIFDTIIDANDKYFGEFAALRMKQEMCDSAFYNVQLNADCRGDTESNVETHPVCNRMRM